jgi:hypothetical protein
MYELIGVSSTVLAKVQSSLQRSLSMVLYSGFRAKLIRADRFSDCKVRRNRSR